MLKTKVKDATTDRHQVYTKVVKTLKQLMEMKHQGHIATLAMMIAGIVLSRNAQLFQMSLEVPVAAKDKIMETLLRKWVKHEKIDKEVKWFCSFFLVLTCYCIGESTVEKGK